MSCQTCNGVFFPLFICFTDTKVCCDAGTYFILNHGGNNKVYGGNFRAIPGSTQVSHHSWRPSSAGIWSWVSACKADSQPLSCFSSPCQGCLSSMGNELARHTGTVSAPRMRGCKEMDVRSRGVVTSLFLGYSIEAHNIYKLTWLFPWPKLKVLALVSSVTERSSQILLSRSFRYFHIMILV